MSAFGAKTDLKMVLVKESANDPKRNLERAQSIDCIIGANHLIF